MSDSSFTCSFLYCTFTCTSERALKTGDADDYELPLGATASLNFGYRVYNSKTATTTVYRRMSETQTFQIEINKDAAYFLTTLSAVLGLSIILF